MHRAIHLNLSVNQYESFRCFGTPASLRRFGSRCGVFAMLLVQMQPSLHRICCID